MSLDHAPSQVTKARKTQRLARLIQQSVTL